MNFNQGSGAAKHFKVEFALCQSTCVLRPLAFELQYWARSAAQIAYRQERGTLRVARNDSSEVQDIKCCKRIEAHPVVKFRLLLQVNL